MQRDVMLQRISDPGRIWDLIVIGGGATGLGIAWNAAAQGYSVAVVEQLDIAHGTSSRSTKLIHGGVRYLRQGQIGMVRSALHEREYLLQAARPWVWPLQLVLPSYRLGSRWYYYCGLKAYDMLAGRRNMGPARLLSSARTRQLLPSLKSEGLRGGVSFFDGQFDDARLALHVAQAVTASPQGVVLNYAPVLSIDTHQASGNRIVHIQDSCSGKQIQLQARVAVNATGVLADKVSRLERSALTQDRPISISPSRGTHLVLSSDFLPGKCALMIPQTDDGRVLFAIPWLGHTLLGTTDVATDSVDREPCATDQEIDYLLDHAGRYLSTAPKRIDVLSVFSGLRPLMGKSSGSTASLSREHEIIVSNKGLISVIGGKWTTFRKMGRDVLELAVQVGKLEKRTYVPPVLPSVNISKVATSGSPRIDAHDQALSPVLPISVEDIRRAIQEEMAVKLEDVLSRRTRCLLLNAAATLEIAPQVVNIIAELTGRDASWQAAELAEFRELVRTYQVSRSN